MWNDVRNKLPKLNPDGESDEVLCIVSKFGDPIKKRDDDSFVILWWDGKTWQSWDDDDYEENGNNDIVTHWMDIPKLEIAVADGRHKTKRVSSDGVFFRCDNCGFEPQMGGETDDLLIMHFCPKCGCEFEN